jgi:type VI secretion system protein ImpK
MNPKFAAAVDPIFLYVIGHHNQILERGSAPAEAVREGIQNRFRQADALLTEKRQQEGWELAKYALAAWIDDLFIGATWQGRDWWENNSLEFMYFNTRDRATHFFLKSKDAARLTRRDALEVFYVCVVLGFRGLYGLPDAAFLAEQLELPPDLESWARRTAKSIELGQGRPPIYPASRPGDGAPPLEGRFYLLGASLAAAALAIFTAVVGYYMFAG